MREIFIGQTSSQRWSHTRNRDDCRSQRAEAGARAILVGVRWLVPAVVVCAVAACVAPNAAPDRLVVHFDAGADAGADVGADVAFDVRGDAEPFDAGGPLGTPCVDDAQCDDKIACTYDSCAHAVGRCVHVPDDTLCSNGIFCDGMERCVLGHGCEPGAVVTCGDGTACDISNCVEATKSCAHTPRDVDQDGDPDSHCGAGHDCNDFDPTISSLHAEVCANGIDDNCNGVVDEVPCVAPLGNTCGNAVAEPGAGTYELSTVGCDETFSTSCSVTDPSSGQNVVAAVTVPPGPNVDIEVWATTSSVEVAVALQKTCGQPSSELACGSGPGAVSVRARARNVPPGTYYAIVTTQSETTVELNVEIVKPTSSPTNVDCATAAPIQPGLPTTVSIIDQPILLPSACITAAAAARELTYSFTLAQTQDVRVYASTLRGSGSAILGLRMPPCSGAHDELSCRTGSSMPIYVRALPPGTYVVTVAATSPIDVNLLVDVSSPSATPIDQTCAAPPPIAANTSVAFDLANHQDAIKDGCFPGGLDAAYDLTLPTASDVLLIEHLPWSYQTSPSNPSFGTPQSEEGAVSLDAPDCARSMACAKGTTPVRVGARNVAAGDYRAIVTDQLGLKGSIDALVRPTVAPTILPPGSADTCAAPLDVSAGGFFAGDTSAANPNYGNPCDAPTSPPGGAADQVLALTLSAPQRVVLDMEGSTYTTILDVRQGPSCPGAPVAGGCYVGFEAQRSFLDLPLPAGQYWIIVDGYSRASGPWDLDVRVLPP